MLRAVDATDADAVTRRRQLLRRPTPPTRRRPSRENGEPVDIDGRRRSPTPALPVRHRLRRRHLRRRPTPTACSPTAKDGGRRPRRRAAARRRSVAIVTVGGAVAAAAAASPTDRGRARTTAIDELDARRRRRRALPASSGPPTLVDADELACRPSCWSPTASTTPTTPVEIARGGLLDAGAALYVVGLQDGGLDEAAFARPGRGDRRSHGRRPPTPSDDRRPRRRAARRAARPAVPLDLRVRRPTAGVAGPRRRRSATPPPTARTSPAARSIGADRARPEPPVEPGGLAFFRSRPRPARSASASPLVAVALCRLRRRPDLRQGRRRRSSHALQPYADGYVAERGRGRRRAGMAQTAFLQRAVEITEQLRRAPGLPRPRSSSSSSGPTCPCGPARRCSSTAPASSLVLVGLAGADRRTCSARSSSASSAPCVPPAIAQLPGAAPQEEASRPSCPTRSSCCRARCGPATRSCRASRPSPRRSPSPMGKELRRVVTEARLGRPLEESLDAVAERMDSARLRLGRHGHPHPAGGRRQPVRAAADRGRDDDRSASACAATSPRSPPRARSRAIVLGVLPVGLGVVMYVDQPRLHRRCCSTRRIGPDHARRRHRARWSSASPG